MPTAPLSDQVGEHHSHLAAFGSVLRSCNIDGLAFRVRSNRLTGFVTGNCAQNFPTITEDDAKFFQVLIGQLGKNG